MEQSILSKDVIERYSRQMLIPEISFQGQSLLSSAKVLIVGCGGIGSPTALYLAGAGVGTIGLIDHDVVEESNLHRQVLHNIDRIGINKAESAKMTLSRFNQYIKIITYQEQLNQNNADNIFKDYDIILDASDNPQTRYIVNDASIINKKILVSGSSLGWEGQITIYGYKGGPCYRCLYPVCPKGGSVRSCGEAGVVGPIPGIIGLLEAVETIKIITNAESILSGEMIIYDGLLGSFKKLKLRKRQMQQLIYIKMFSITVY